MRCRLAACVTLVFGLLIAGMGPARAQEKGVPGKFDFYLLDLPWGPEFCAIKDVSAQCKPQRGFVVHGLWAQNFDGTWPVFCSNEAGPPDLRPHLDITPDLQLLQHEWDKHGTCSAVGPQRFFAMEHSAAQLVKVPAQLQGVTTDLAFTPEWLLRMFSFENPGFPEGGFVLSCKDGKLTAVEACFNKDLQPIACKGLHSCPDRVIHVENGNRAIR